MGDMAEYYLEHDFPRDDEWEEYEATKKWIERNMNKDNQQTDKPIESLVVAGMPVPEPVKTDKEPMTSQQLRVVEVSEALAPAYAKASTLELTEAEINGLTLPFSADKVEVRPHDGLIYIPHIHISNRLNAVFNPGKWSLICRRHWLEGGTMYGEYILLIKGCYVGESVGGHPYIANNPKTNYSDSLESTAAEALRRICGKRLSCGSQVWDPTYANDWCMKYRFQANGKYYKKMDPTKPAEPTKKPETKEPTKAEQQEKAKKFALRLSDVRDMATQYCVDLGWILPDHEGLADVSYTHLPKTEGQFKQFWYSMEQWGKDGVVKDPYHNHPAPEPVDPTPEPESVEDESEEEEWRKFPMPYGNSAGKNLEDLEKKYLYGLWANVTVETTWTNSEGKVIKVKPEKIEQAKKLREMLDMAGKHYEFTKND